MCPSSTQICCYDQEAVAKHICICVSTSLAEPHWASLWCAQIAITIDNFFRHHISYNGSRDRLSLEIELIFYVIISLGYKNFTSPSGSVMTGKERNFSCIYAFWMNWEMWFIRLKLVLKYDEKAKKTTLFDHNGSFVDHNEKRYCLQNCIFIFCYFSQYSKMTKMHIMWLTCVTQLTVSLSYWIIDLRINQNSVNYRSQWY